ncbi:DUF305 domain-containing protein [Streptomyces sp. NPDC005496]|uniref:DUF305 domain-containing protein n=2 Tax=unclassified Streptomyces TaxID=2593676 RepID=UPI0036B87D6D
MTSHTRAQRRTPVRRAVTAGALAAGALLLTACGGDGGSGGTAHGGHDGSASASARAGSFNDADVAFAQMMIPHHEQALEMARLAPDRASDPEVKKLATKIEKAQAPEIRTMKGWLTSWNEPTSMESMPGMDHGGGDGMMSGTDMARLKGMKGAEFDEMFTEMMIDHHNGAIGMAEDEQKKGENADAVKTAGDIVTSQSAEVEQLKGILGRL